MFFTIFYDILLMTRHRSINMVYFTFQIFLLLFRLPSNIVDLVCHKHFAVRQSILINWTIANIVNYEIEYLIIFESQLNPVKLINVSIILRFRTSFFIFILFLWIISSNLPIRNCEVIETIGIAAAKAFVFKVIGG